MKKIAVAVGLLVGLAACGTGPGMEEPQTSADPPEVTEVAFQAEDAAEPNVDAGRADSTALVTHDSSTPLPEASPEASPTADATPDVQEAATPPPKDAGKDVAPPPDPFCANMKTERGGLCTGIGIGEIHWIINLGCKAPYGLTGIGGTPVYRPNGTDGCVYRQYGQEFILCCV